MTPHEAYVAFNMLPDIGSVRLDALIGEYGDVVTAWEATGDRFAATGEQVNWQRELERAEKMHVKLVTRADAEYPQQLNDLASAPLALYVTGDPKVLSMPSVALVGTRNATLYGSDMAGKFARELAARGFGIVSGLATGIDACAHRGALEAGGRTYGIIGSALDRFFPDENRALAHRIVESGGAVVSEFPFGFPPGKNTFPQRNRIVAAISRATLAIEAPLNSGTLITCKFAKEMNRPILAVPANLDSPHSAGCWKLIRDGAGIAMDADVVAKACGGSREKDVAQPKPTANSNASGSQPVQLTLEESVVLRETPSTGISLDMLCMKTKLPLTRVNAAVVALRTKGKLRFLPGNRVAPTKA